MKFLGKSVFANRLTAPLLLALSWLVLLLPFIYYKDLPLPGVQDEFSYLLAAKTYASGHLSNPSPEVPEVFQSFHILVVPTHISKYLPGLGLQLAVGVILGHPIFGVWLTTLASVLAAYWMLRAVAPRCWAFMGAEVYLLCFGLGSYFGHSYWGGSLFLLEGLLMTGAVLRLLQRDSWQASLWLGIGAAGMLMTRPIEGGLYTAIWLLALAISRRRGSLQDWWRLLRISLLPSASVLLLAVAFLVINNIATTGSPTRFAYAEYEAQYGLLGWEDSNTRLTPPPEFADLVKRVEQRKASGIVDSFNKMTGGFAYWRSFYLPAFFVPVTALGLIFELGRRSSVGVVAFALLLFKLVHPLLLLASHHYHYTSVLVAPLLILLVSGSRLLFVLKIRRSRIRFVAWSNLMFVMIGAMSIYGTFISFKHLNQPYAFGGFAAFREALRLHFVQAANEQGKGVIVVVKYLPGHVFDQELVYNDPIPSQSAVVWTRFMGLDALTSLEAAYPGRDWWVVQVGSGVESVTRTGSMEATRAALQP